MGYCDALRAAGAEVLAYGEFGSYQGDWWAKVSYAGKIGWVHGYFGSCSGCDAFESEFGWGGPTPERLAAFGRGYLDDILTQEQAEAKASEHIDWDLDARGMLDFIINERIDAA